MFLLTPFLFGLLALFLGQDANWDLRNYHWYNAYAFLNGRYGFDLLPSQTPWFYNPLLDVPYFLLANAVPAKLAAFILGTVQGLNFLLLFYLAKTALVIDQPQRKFWTCFALALLGMLGGGGIAQIGTVFYDNVTSLGIFLSALLVVRWLPRLTAGQGWGLAVVAGIPAGMMMGLKLPSVIFCVGLCGALLFVAAPVIRRLQLAFLFGLGVLLGLGITYGYWGWFLHENFGSPLFPYFNNFFQSPLAPLSSARDTQFMPDSWWERLLFPFLFGANPKLVGEIDWQDWRLAVWYGVMGLVLLIVPAFRLRQGFGGQGAGMTVPPSTRFLLALGVISYAVWLGMFAIYRYLIPLEMLAPLLIVLAVGLFPLRHKIRWIMTAVLLLVIAVSVRPGDWTRQNNWLEKAVMVEVPALGNTQDLMILMAGFEPYSHVIPSFPPEIPFVRMQSNFASPNEDKGMNAVIRARVEGHKGRFMMLIPPWQHDLAQEALAHYALRLDGGKCQKVVDYLYDEYQLDLCHVTRKKR